MIPNSKAFLLSPPEWAEGGLDSGETGSAIDELPPPPLRNDDMCRVSRRREAGTLGGEVWSEREREISHTSVNTPRSWRDLSFVGNRGRRASAGTGPRKFKATGKGATARPGRGPPSSLLAEHDRFFPEPSSLARRGTHHSVSGTLGRQGHWLPISTRARPVERPRRTDGPAAGGGGRGRATGPAQSRSPITIHGTPLLCLPAQRYLFKPTLPIVTPLLAETCPSNTLFSSHPTRSFPEASSPTRPRS